MSPSLIFDLSRIDQSVVEFPIEEIRQVNPHRHEFEQLDGIFRVFPQEHVLVGFKDVKRDEFWVRGHLPGMPLLPGVLMIEAAAQLASFYQGRSFPGGKFFAFGGVDRARFRGMVRPGDRLILIAKGTRVSPRFSTFETQGLVGESLVFEAAITGVAATRRDVHHGERAAEEGP